MKQLEQLQLTSIEKIPNASILHTYQRNGHKDNSVITGLCENHTSNKTQPFWFSKRKIIKTPIFLKFVETDK